VTPPSVAPLLRDAAECRDTGRHRDAADADDDARPESLECGADHHRQ